MIEFEWPWLFCLVLLPWLVRLRSAEVSAVNHTALRIPFIEDIRRVTRAERKSERRSLVWLAFVAWLLGVVAVARPVWIGAAIDLPINGRDLMLAVDLSQSMEETDFELRGQMVDRLTAIKAVAGDFIARRIGDRLGLILFGEQAYLQVPLTFDRKTVAALLNEAQIGLAGNATAIGDAIGVAIKRLGEGKSHDQVVILLTDGANTAGELEPLKAAELAAKAGLKVYTIGVGADEVMIRNLFGLRRVNPSADLDEKTLTEIARRTGGRYFRARDAEQLGQIYAMLDELEPAAQEARTYRPQRALYVWPLSGSLVLAGWLLILRARGTMV